MQSKSSRPLEISSRSSSSSSQPNNKQIYGSRMARVAPSGPRVVHVDDESSFPSADGDDNSSQSCTQCCRGFCNAIMCCMRVICPCSCMRSCLTPSPRLISSFPLTKIQAQRWVDLHRRSLVVYDNGDVDHRRLLTSFGMAAIGESFSGEDELVSAKWKSIGFQGNDPSTDFRGGGLLALANLTYFVALQRDCYMRISRRNAQLELEAETKTAANGNSGSAANSRAASSLDGVANRYLPFAICGINLTFLLTSLLSVKSSFRTPIDQQQQLMFTSFIALLEHDEYAFEEVYSGAMLYLEERWTTYLEAQQTFTSVIDRVRQALLTRPSTSREFHRRMAADDGMTLPVQAWEHGRAERIAAHEERRRTGGVQRSSYGAIGSATTTTSAAATSAPATTAVTSSSAATASNAAR